MLDTALWPHVLPWVCPARAANLSSKRGRPRTSRPSLLMMECRRMIVAVLSTHGITHRALPLRPRAPGRGARGGGMRPSCLLSAAARCSDCGPFHMPPLCSLARFDTPGACSPRLRARCEWELVLVGVRMKRRRNEALRIDSGECSHVYSFVSPPARPPVGAAGTVAQMIYTAGRRVLKPQPEACSYSQMRGGSDRGPVSAIQPPPCLPDLLAPGSTALDPTMKQLFRCNAQDYTAP